jgi:hypothetical protein
MHPLRTVLPIALPLAVICGGHLDAQSQIAPRLDALLAQVSGGGECLRVTDDPAKVFIREEAIASPFFPGVQITRAWCIAEHGDSIAAWAAEDSDSVLYVLGSRVGFEFLLRRHPPVLITEQTALDYVHFSLQIQGVLPGDAGYLRDTTLIPAAITSRTGMSRSEIGVSRILQRQGSGERRSVAIYFAAHDTQNLWSGIVYLDLPAGYFFSTIERRVAR